MNEGLLPRRYAKALYEFACEKDCSQRVYTLMKTLVKSFSEMPSLGVTLSNPYVSNSDKVTLLNTAAGATDTDSVFTDFLKLLEHNNRLGFCRDIAQAYIDLYRVKNHIFEVHVTSAAPFSSQEEQRLKSMIESHLHGGVMEYHHGINPDLIGGFTVSVGNERLDASVSNELNQLRLNLLSK
ncbi:MAG: F0F1 ATP synthase subunit delta [Paramuribaculum sp.]|nr:F0F1 ATP synthase subunit delta [Paramuribaculum sp.]